jgi:hypothetical protein
MPGLVKKLSAVVGILFVGLPLQMLAANAQQNPFVGTWSTTQASGGITAFVDYFENGTVHLSGPVRVPGVVQSSIYVARINSIQHNRHIKLCSVHTAPFYRESLDLLISSIR